MNRKKWIIVAIVFSHKKELHLQHLHNILYLFRNLIAHKYLSKDFYNDWYATEEGPYSKYLEIDINSLLKDEELLSIENKILLKDESTFKEVLKSIEHLPAATKSYMNVIINWVTEKAYHGLINSMTIDKAINRIKKK